MAGERKWTEEWSVHYCTFADKNGEYKEDGACGFNGQGYDCSRDECHHPIDEEEARRVVVCMNLFRGIDDPATALRELVGAAMKISEDFPPIEKKHYAQGNISRDYLSPAGVMVSSELILALRAALSRFEAVR